MRIDLSKFTGTLPYASELFGIYQPLLGWRSKLTKDRMGRGQDSVLRSFTERALARVPANVSIRIGNEGPEADNLAVPDVIDVQRVPRVAAEIESIIAYKIAAKLPMGKPPAAKEWRALLDRDKVLNPALDQSKTTIFNFLRNRSENVINDDISAYLQHALDPFSNQELPLSELLRILLNREVAVSAYLNWLAQTKPDLLDTLFYRSVTNPFQDILLFQDPLSTFGQTDLQAVLSPIGLVHLFRQYFFEFDTFLGPAVGHIWIAPGSTLELIEQSSRRVVVERSVELSTDTTQKSETSSTVQDELSTAVREENRNDIKFGFGASVNYHNGTLDAGAHTDLSLNNARASARDTTHKQMREQSERLTAEIRQGFRSTFKTTTETIDTSSRRYVLQNSTTALINYELRRKMRQVGVQVQDIGTQLCWQVYVDDAGRELGVSKLLHISEPPDRAGLQAPAPAARLEQKTAELNIQFPYARDPSSEGDGETDVLYIEGDDQEHIGGVHNIGYNDKIFHRKTFVLQPPAAGYRLAQIDQLPARSQHPGTVNVEVRRVNETSIEVIMHQVNFKDQPFVELQVTSLWDPDPAQQKALDDAAALARAQYDQERSTQDRIAFVRAAKERITLASKIQKRRFEDLREEERTAVYRRLISQLMTVGEAQGQDEPVTSELIRAIFDVDSMLYFVAPEWWRARNYENRNKLSLGSSTQTLSENDVVSWEGPKATGRKDNYIITEESDPQPLGASLGWLLQLDGDNLRNAFLNSPWVKAIIPIRPGRELAAINWLTLANVAGTDGLDATYQASPQELRRIHDGLIALGISVGSTITIRDALVFLGHEIQRDFKAITTAKPSPFDPTTNVIPTETVFEHGFDPLAGGFEVNTDPARVFSQWIEVLPTDQVVAVEYDAKAAGATPGTPPNGGTGGTGTGTGGTGPGTGTGTGGTGTGTSAGTEPGTRTPGRGRP